MESNKVYYRECYCEFCGKKFSNQNGLNGHRPYCKENPNRLKAWNKGLTKETSEIVKSYAEKQILTRGTEEFKKSHPIWNKGLTKETDDRVKKYGASGSITKSDPQWKEALRNKIYKKYGGLHFTQTKEYAELKKKNSLEKWGTEYPIQNPEVARRQINAFKAKDYKTPSGKILKVKGFEPQALNLLFNKYHFKEDDIECDYRNMPEIYYDFNGSTHRYFPDIYIKSLNKIIEVKSWFTLDAAFHRNIEKHKACENLGINHSFWVMNDKELEEEIYELYEGCREYDSGRLGDSKFTDSFERR